MGHYCRICGRTRANEKFLGKGYRKHICKDCAGKAKAMPHPEEEFEYSEWEINNLINELKDEPMPDYDDEELPF